MGAEHLIERGIGDVRVHERLLAAVHAIHSAGTAVERVLEVDADTAPEVKAANAHLVEAVNALARAAVYLEARRDRAFGLES